MGTFLAASTATQCASRNTWDQGAVEFTDHNRDLQINGQNTAISLLPQDYADIDVPCCAFRNRSYLRFKKKESTDWQQGRFIFSSNRRDPKATREITINSAAEFTRHTTTIRTAFMKTAMV